MVSSLADRAGGNAAARRPSSAVWPRDQHPLSDPARNAELQRYEQEIKGAFDRIVPVLQQLSFKQHEPRFPEVAQALAHAELGFALPQPILENAWVGQLDMRTLYAWCVFETYQRISDQFFRTIRSLVIKAKHLIASSLSADFICWTSRHVLMGAWPMPSPTPFVSP